MEKTNTAITSMLKKAHKLLLKDLEELEAATNQAPAKSIEDMLARLEATRSHILQHFRVEEQDGYMNVVRNREPRLERTIDKLAEEHCQLGQSLNTLIARAGALAKLDEPLREAIRRWVNEVRDHEEREDIVVQDVFNLDIGPED